MNTALPTITGTPQVGQTLSTKGGTWTSSTQITKVTYEWWRCDAKTDVCSAVNGAGGTSYEVTGADAGHTIRVAQTVTNGAGSTTAASHATAVVTTANGKPVATVLPSITGTPQIGQTLKAKAGTWYSPTTIKKTTYAWWRCDAKTGACATIDRATGTSYKVVDADAGHTIRVAVTVTNSAGSTTEPSASTAAVSPLKPVSTALPTITGTAQVGQTLTTKGGRWSSATPFTSTTYQWWRCDAKTGACTVISGANGTSYTVVAADAGHTIRVAQTVANSQGSATAASGTTPVVTFSSGAIAATSVALPNRLVISGVKFAPRSLRSRNTFMAQFRVTDSSGRPVAGALVYALGLPYSWVQKGVEVATSQNGWATIPITPSRKMPLGKGHALVMFIRARVPGQSILAGASSRRLVQVRIGY